MDVIGQLRLSVLTAMQRANTDKLLYKLLLSTVLLLVLWVARRVVTRVLSRKVTDPKRIYHTRRAITYVFTALVFVLVGRIWIEGIRDLSTFLGLLTAGLAVAMHETLANVMGWILIIWKRPFKVGDRIEIGGVAGDVIDIRVFQFSMIEIRNWIGADQSTGRIVHVPNGKVLREPLANYETGFEYIWHEIPVLLTFESDWRKAKEILQKIAHDKTEHLSSDAETQIRRAASQYLIFYRKLTPVVYTRVADSGVLLTIRYIIKPRQRRGSEEEVWEAILAAFAEHKDIDFAYPTTRFYDARVEAKAVGGAVR